MSLSCTHCFHNRWKNLWSVSVKTWVYGSLVSPLSCLAPGLLDATDASFKSKRRPGGSLLPWEGKAWRLTLKCKGSHANIWRAIDWAATVVANPNCTLCCSPTRHLDGENCKIELLHSTPAVTENVSLHSSLNFFYCKKITTRRFTLIKRHTDMLKGNLLNMHLA